MNNIIYVAHLHHAWENYRTLGKTKDAFIQALCISMFQFTYTTVFGWYVSYLFLKTGNLWPCVLCHSFCNIMGFPDFDRIQDKSKKQKQRKHKHFFYKNELTKGILCLHSHFGLFSIRSHLICHFFSIIYRNWSEFNVLEITYFLSLGFLSSNIFSINLFVQSFTR